MSALHFDKLLLFGDSITEFAYDQFPLNSTEPQFTFAPAIHNSYVRRLEVIQRGFAGYNTDWALKLLPKIIQCEHRPLSGCKIRLATVFFGTNDAALAGMQKVDLEKYISNVTQFLDIFEKEDIRVVLIGPAKHDQDKWHPIKQQDVANGIIRTNENNLRYSAALKNLAEERDVAFVDLYTAFATYSGDWRDLLIDGVHFTGKGYRIMFDEVMRAIREKYPDLAPENLQYKFPYWRDFNEADFENELQESIN